MCKSINFEPFAYAFQGHARKGKRRRFGSLLSVLFWCGFPGYALTVCRGEPQKAKRPRKTKGIITKMCSVPFRETKVWYFFVGQSIGITEGNSVKSGDEQRNAHKFHTYPQCFFSDLVSKWNLIWVSFPNLEKGPFLKLA